MEHTKKKFMLKKRGFSGTTDPTERTYEKKHRKIARKAAAEGMVLLKNENQILPLKKGSEIALYGSGATRTIKGGTGSGDVNARETVSVFQGLKAAGFQITTEKWLEEYEKFFQKAREDWRAEIWKKAEQDKQNDDGMGFFNAYCSTPFIFPAGSLPEETAADTAVFILGRNAGEGADRFDQPGDYDLTEEEQKILGKICNQYSHVIFVVNAGGLIDLSVLDQYKNIEGLIYMQQAGMEAGNALADILTGEVTPEGKLTDSWAFTYKDYPNAETFSHQNGNIQEERYEEGIYVGYRYFDTFQIPVRYGFGFGLSYTSFTIRMEEIQLLHKGEKHPEIAIKVQVQNTGDCFSGREVVQVYASCPQEKTEKEYRKLAGFTKTGVLAPGETEELTVSFKTDYLAFYDAEKPGWVLERGEYGIFIGDSLESSRFEATILAENNILLTETANICPLQEDLTEMKPPVEKTLKRRKEWEDRAADKPLVVLHERDMQTCKVQYESGYGDIPVEVREFVDTLSEDQLIQLATGAVQGAEGSNLGSAGKSVPGSAAQTANCAEKQNLASIVLADGPAGLRLISRYQMENGEIVPAPLEMSMEGGFLCKEQPEKKGTSYYQYCTAFPVGTLLAQTWDVKLLEEVGKAVAEEMQEFGVTLWLAPGMNIHRNPLCGRNFEYYSEDPVVSGMMAAAVTRGVQSEKGCGTTIKHFCCNNQEDNRMHSNSIVSERALREIYLKGFELVVKESQPFAIMTSYNLINGIHAANNHDLCTGAVRNEWGFQGLIMTDWTTTHYGPDCTASGCMRAGNDLVMPGIIRDHENMKQELKEGTLDIRDLKRSIGRLINIIWQSNQYD